MRSFLKSRITVFILIAACVTGIGIFFRLYPVLHTQKGHLYSLAKEVVQNYWRQQIGQSIKATSPNLNNLQKKKLTELKTREFIKNNPQIINSMIENGITELSKNDAYRPNPFLLEADSYHFYGLTENILETGSISPKIKDGKYFNPLMLAPLGKWEPVSLHPYAGFWLYKLASRINPKIGLMPVVKMVVIILSALCLIPFLLICVQLGIHWLPAFTGAVFLILSPFFTQRTVYGWYDTDVYNILFPLVILCVLFAGFKNLDKLKSNVCYAFLASFLTAAYELFWHGWSFIFILMLSSLPIILIIQRKFWKIQDIKGTAVFFLVYLGSVFFWISILVSPMTFIYTFQEGWTMVNSFLSTKFDLWPNIFLTVGETQPMSLPKVSFLIGGNIFYIYLACLGPILTFIKAMRTKDKGLLAISIILSVFICIFFYLSLKAVRFAILLTVPLSISFAIFLDFIYSGLNHLADSRIKPGAKIPYYLIKSISLFLVLGLSVLPVFAAHQICSRIYPIYNQDWEDVMIRLKDETPKDSIINTWWCPGHFITAVAKRGVSVDGASQQEPQGYWIANVLLSQDESTAVGLLRMLNSSGNKAFEYLQNKCGIIISEAVSLLKEIAPLDKNKARLLLLSRGLTSPDADNILLLTHSTPGPSYFLIYNELIDTYAALPYIGNWDFKKAESLVLHSLSSKKTKDEINQNKFAIPSRDSKGFIDFILSLSGGLPACSPKYDQVLANNNIIKFQNNLVVDLFSKESFLISDDGNKFIKPKSLLYVENGEFMENVYPGATLPWSVLLIEKGSSYQCMVLDNSLAKSLLFKLYYLKGKGLNHFTPYISNEGTGKKNTIMVYRINW